MTDAVPEPALQLLIQCCRRNFVAGPSSAIEVPAGIDWKRFVTLARFHRVQGLAWNALKEAPLAPEVREALSGDARSIAANNLAIARECAALRDAFEAANVSLLFIKGLTVAALAYRNPMLKMAWDIDLLIEARDLETAAALLTEQGYSLKLPSRREQLQSWHARSKESVWHRDHHVHVELHSRLADNERLIPTIGVQSPRQQVPLAPSISLPTLAEEQLFAYLAVHGASSAWFRLKWISDFAGLTGRRNAHEVEQLYRRSQELGAARASGQALLLADRLFDVLDTAPDLRKLLIDDRSNRILCNAALRMMMAGSEPTERPLGTLTIHWTQMLLKPDIAFKLSELRRQSAALLSRSGH